jgi:hypothetical protein
MMDTPQNLLRIHLHLLQEYAHKEHVSSHCIPDNAFTAHAVEQYMNHQESINPWEKMSWEVFVSKNMNRHAQRIKIP